MPSIRPRLVGRIADADHAQNSSSLRNKPGWRIPRRLAGDELRVEHAGRHADDLVSWRCLNGIGPGGDDTNRGGGTFQRPAEAEPFPSAGASPIVDHEPIKSRPVMPVVR